MSGSCYTGMTVNEHFGVDAALTGESAFGQRAWRPGRGLSLRRMPAMSAPKKAHDRAVKLRRRLSGDLDNIVMMALRKEPQRRYASAEQLSEDIRRHLEGRPVRARKPTFSYRGSKFVRRHRASLAAATLFVLSIAGFTVATVRARARAEREAVTAQVISDFMQKTLAAADPFSGVGRDVTVVEALGKAVEEIEGSFPGEAEVRAAFQKTIGTTYQELGRFPEFFQGLGLVLLLEQA